MKSSTKAWVLLAIVSTTLVLAGHYLAGRQGVLWAVIISLSINSLLYFYGDLRIKRLITGQTLEGQDPWGLNETVSKIAKRSRIPQPKIIVLPSQASQAMSFGRNWKSGHLIFTQGLMEKLDPTEIEGVAAYLLAAIKRQDTLAFSLASGVCGFLLGTSSMLDRLFRLIFGSQKPGSLSNHLFTYLVAPFVGKILRLAVSEKDYFAIDKSAAELTDNPMGLAHAIWKLDCLRHTHPLDTNASLGHFYIVSPLENNTWTRYLKLHPPAEQRIRNLVGHYPI